MFLYFDLGNVVARFDHLKGCRQMAEVAGISPEQVFAAVFDSELNRRYELGEVTSREFFDEFCRATGTHPDFDAFYEAAGDIFELNSTLIPVLTALEDAGYRLGLLSNTCECHWHRIRQSEYGIFSVFSAIALSYEIKAMKPDSKIYHVAAELADVKLSDVFFCDDVMAHVIGAREAGFDAVQYTTTPSLVADLRRRGMRFNY